MEGGQTRNDDHCCDSNIVVPRDVWNIISDYVPKTKFVIKVHHERHAILKLNHIIEIDGPFKDNNYSSYFRVRTKHMKKINIIVNNRIHTAAYDAIAKMIK